EAMTVLPMMEAALELLQAGKPARILLNGIAPEDLRILQGLNLLTSHPVLYVCNVAEADAATGNAHTKAVEQMAAAQGARTVV
ncbi:MAG: redox-regulated ATPase YchF, partial [Mesorhizobium sp.]